MKVLLVLRRKNQKGMYIAHFCILVFRSGSRIVTAKEQQDHPYLGLYTSVLPEVSQPTEKCFPLKWNYKP